MLCIVTCVRCSHNYPSGEWINIMYRFHWFCPECGFDNAPHYTITDV